MAGTTGEIGKGWPGPARATLRAGRLQLAAYRAATWLLRPAAGVILSYRERRGKEERDRLGERLGRASRPRPPGLLVWVHAASVGEAVSVLPLIGELGRRRPGASVLLTTGTVTSARSMAGRLPPHALHQYVPLDAPQLVARFLDHWRPSLAVLTEQEIWPNLVVESSRRAIPLALVNARMSEASFRRWQRRLGLAHALFSRFGVVLAQSETYVARLRALGAVTAERSGNLKVDAPAPPVREAELRRLDAALSGRPRLLAASTHEGEEEVLAAAHRELAGRWPGFCTIIAPRHPERGPALASRLRSDGFSVALRSQGELPVRATDIYLADTIGELGTLYAASPVAFIGGSLIPHGGQNPIEAVRLGAAVLTGPSRWNFAEAYDALMAAGGACEADGAAAISARVTALLADAAALDRMRRAGALALADLGGALERTLAALLPLIPETGAPARAD